MLVCSLVSLFVYLCSPVLVITSVHLCSPVLVITSVHLCSPELVITSVHLCSHVNVKNCVNSVCIGLLPWGVHMSMRVWVGVNWDVSC